MSTIDSSASNNGHGTKAWWRSWTHFGIDRRSPGYCHVTFDHPPNNAITARTVWELADLVELIRHDLDLNVVVFDSANPAFFLIDDNGQEPRPIARPPADDGRSTSVARDARASVRCAGGQHRGDSRASGRCR
jgi:hypothetical protein